jgi:hypothetical protein
MAYHVRHLPANRISINGRHIQHAGGRCETFGSTSRDWEPRTNCEMSRMATSGLDVKFLNAASTCAVVVSVASPHTLQSAHTSPGERQTLRRCIAWSSWEQHGLGERKQYITSRRRVNLATERRDRRVRTIVHDQEVGVLARVHVPHPRQQQPRHSVLIRDHSQQRTLTGRCHRDMSSSVSDD